MFWNQAFLALFFSGYWRGFTRVLHQASFRQIYENISISGRSPITQVKFLRIILICHRVEQAKSLVWNPGCCWLSVHVCWNSGQDECDKFLLGATNVKAFVFSNGMFIRNYCVLCLGNVIVKVKHTGFKLWCFWSAECGFEFYLNTCNKQDAWPLLLWPLDGT